LVGLSFIKTVSYVLYAKIETKKVVPEKQRGQPFQSFGKTPSAGAGILRGQVVPIKP